MKKRRLGKTDLSVSELGLGCWALGGEVTINNIPTTYGSVDEKTAIDIISRAIELGVNVFDTADVYSLGNSEKRLAKVLKSKRDEVYLFTKAGGIPAYDDVKPYVIDLSYHHLMSAIDRSLKRLETDYVDLFQIHSVPKIEDDFNTIEKVFHDLKREGKIRYAGVSIGKNYEKGIELIERGIVDTLQMYYSIIDFQAEDNILNIAKNHDIGIIVSEPLAQGFLTGKYDEDYLFPKNDIRSTLERNDIKKRCKIAKNLEQLVDNSKSMSQIALSYILHSEEISVCIPSAKNILQLESNCKTSEIKLSDEDIAKINQIQKILEY